MVMGMSEASCGDRVCGKTITEHVQPLLVTACQEDELIGQLKQIP